MTYISFANTSSVDSFGRLRVSQAQSEIECKFLQNAEPYLHNDLTVGGGNIVYDFNSASVNLTVTAANGDKVVRESHRYMPYVPGNSMVFMGTAVLGALKVGNIARVGIFNDNNGLFFERNGTDLRVVIRTNTSGSASDANFVTQSNWNRDKLDGTGSSGLILDLTKGQVFVIDYQWLGYGRVRFGFDFGGRIVFCHEYAAANTIAIPYMRRPSLPVRYEIYNVADTASSTILKQTCYSAKSEGPTTLQGTTFSATIGIATRAVTTRQPILAVRLLNTFLGHINRRQIKIESLSVYTKTNDCYFEYGHVHANWTSTTGGTWTGIDTNSGAEYNAGITAITGGTEHTTNGYFVSSGQGSFSGALLGAVDITGGHAWINQNIDSTKSEMAVIYATSMNGTANVTASLTFNEVD